MSSKTPIPAFHIVPKVVLRETAIMAGVESVKFFKESFVKQGFTDASFQPWQKPNTPLAGKRTMYNKGRLMRSIKKEDISMGRILVYADSEYGFIHNEGGYIIVTKAMKAYFWKKYYELTGSVSVNKNNSVSLNKKNVNIGKKRCFVRLWH